MWAACELQKAKCLENILRALIERASPARFFEDALEFHVCERLENCAFAHFVG